MLLYSTIIFWDVLDAALKRFGLGFGEILSKNEFLAVRANSVVIAIAVAQHAGFVQMHLQAFKDVVNGHISRGYQ